MGRILLFAGAALLAITAVIHALGQPMVDGWLQSLSDKQRAGVCLVWVSDSLSWIVVAVLWVVAGWKQRAWLGAAAIGGTIPALTAIGILTIDPTFFGGWMLVGSVALAGAGLLVSSRHSPAGSAGI